MLVLRPDLHTKLKPSISRVHIRLLSSSGPAAYYHLAEDGGRFKPDFEFGIGSTQASDEEAMEMEMDERGGEQGGYVRRIS